MHFKSNPFCARSQCLIDEFLDSYFFISSNYKLIYKKTIVVYHNIYIMSTIFMFWLYHKLRFWEIKILLIFKDFSKKLWYNPIVAAPFWQQKGGVHIVSIFFSSVGVGRYCLRHPCWTNLDYTSQVAWPKEEVKPCGNQAPQKIPSVFAVLRGFVFVYILYSLLFSDFNISYWVR